MFKKIKDLFGIVNFKANALLKDGTELLIEGDVAVGVAVSVVTADGNKPLPDGEYELDSGMLIKVVDGIITEINEPEIESEAPVEEEVPVEETEQPQLSVDEKLTLLENRLTKLEETINTMSTENKELKDTKEKLSKEIKGFEEKLSKMDGADPVKKHKTVVSEDVFNLSPITTSRMKTLGLKK